MSLRSKIIWLFCGFSVVPILIVAAFSYWQVNQHVTEVLGPDTTSLLLPALKSLHITYWLFVIGLAGSTVLAFSVFLRGVTANLEALIRASEKIGDGDLNPWLPPPSDGEVGRLNLAISRMLERLRTMVDQVDMSGRLAVVGQLSSYLAHEIRTPLSSTRMNLQRLQRWSRHGRIPPICREPVEISLKEVDRLTTAVTGILALMKPKESPREPIGIHEAVEHTLEVLKLEMRRCTIEPRLELDAPSDRVLGRPGQIKGVILNLMLNAVEAQPRGGFVQVRSRLVPGGNRGGPMIELRVLDGGPGVPPEIRGHIFDPFFTTKESGSGIGLALTAQSVRENGGEVLLAERVPGQGAEFVVRLPLAPVARDDTESDRPSLALPWSSSPASPRESLSLGALKALGDEPTDSMRQPNLGEVH